MAVPDLSGSGYGWPPGSRRRTDQRRAVMDDDVDHGTRLVKLTRPMATEQNAKMSPLAQVAINGFAWVDHGTGYSLVPTRRGSMPASFLRPARKPSPRCVKILATRQRTGE